MRLINRKGSTLALTIIIFAVLMIFATFVLRFMVTENKQAIYYQNKTQAHYIAKSGAEIVEDALKTQLISYGINIKNQNNFINVYDVERKIDVDIPNMSGPVVVLNEYLNGKKVMTIESTAEYRDIKQSVKKVLYSNYSMKSESGLIPNYGELFIYLGDVKPTEWKNGKFERDIPKEYIRKEDDKSKYKEQPFLSFDESTWNIGNSIVKSGKIMGGIYNESADIFVNGDLIMEGNIIFNGIVNIYVKGKLTINDNTSIIGKKDYATNKYSLNIHVYNELNNTSPNIGLKNSYHKTSSNSGTFRVLGNLYVDKGSILLGFPQTGEIDGHIVYNGTDRIEFETNSNNYNRILTGSIYAPSGDVHIGINSDKVAVLIGGQIIGNSINVYPNNKTQGTKFYENSTNGRIDNNPIPIEQTESIDGYSINYLSFYID